MTPAFPEHYIYVMLARRKQWWRELRRASDGSLSARPSSLAIMWSSRLRPFGGARLRRASSVCPNQGSTESRPTKRLTGTASLPLQDSSPYQKNRNSGQKDRPASAATKCTQVPRPASHLPNGRCRSEEHTSELQARLHLVCR